MCSHEFTLKARGAETPETQIVPKEIPRARRRLPEHCGDLEALFLTPGTVLGAELLGSLRSQWKHSVCLVLGCEVSEAAYVNLRE